MTALSLALLAPTGLPGVTWLYALALTVLAAFWWSRVAREARRGRLPRQGWWFVPGLLGLLLAGPAELPALFGVGAALLLLAEYWPRAYLRPAPPAQRPGLGWPLVGLVTAVLLLSSALIAGEANLATVLTVVGCLVAGVGGLLAAALLDEHPCANEAELRERMSGNLCRCGAYPQIVRAVGQVLWGAHPAPSPSDPAVPPTAPPRGDPA